MNKLSTIVLIILLTVTVILAEGCSPLRKNAIKISESEVKNLVATQEIARNYLKIWPMQSGFIKGALGPRMDEMPEQVVAAINELDQLADQLNNKDPNDIKDYDLGLSLGLRVRLLGAVVQEALSMYAPDVLDLIPLLF